jgi:hypothetical protein
MTMPTPTRVPALTPAVRGDDRRTSRHGVTAARDRTPLRPSSDLYRRMPDNDRRFELLRKPVNVMANPRKGVRLLVKRLAEL